MNLAKKHYMNIAKDLCYGDKCVEDIKNAKTEAEMVRILTSARRGKYKAQPLSVTNKLNK